MALGELHAGLARTVDDFLFVKIGTGIGCGIVVGGEVYRGVDRQRRRHRAHPGRRRRTGLRLRQRRLPGGALQRRRAGPGRDGGGARRPLAGARRPARGRPATLTAADVAAAAAAGDPVAHRAGPRRRPAARARCSPGWSASSTPAWSSSAAGCAGLGHTLLAEIRSVVYRRSLPLATGNLPIVLSELGAAGRRRRRRPDDLRLASLDAMTDGRHDRPPLLAMSGIVKEFPGVRALDGVDLEVRAGEVHCLLGQNGAGKSTLIKVLAGAHQPDAGEIRWQGEPVTLADAAWPRCGPASPPSTRSSTWSTGCRVAENIFLGHEPTGAGFVRRGDAERRGPRRCSPGSATPRSRRRREVGRLSAAGKQIVSMARALSHDARLIVMDEPSAVLAHDEVDNLFRVDPRPHRRRASRSSTSRTGWRRSARSATGSPCSRTAAPSPPACRPRTTPTREVVALMTGRTIEYVFPPRPAAAGRRAPSCSRVDGPRPGAASSPTCRFTVARRRDRRHRRAGRLRPLRDAGDRLRRPPAYRRARSPSTGRTLRRRAASTPPCAPGIGLAPEERKSQAPAARRAGLRNVVAGLPPPLRRGSAGSTGAASRRGRAGGRRAAATCARTTRAAPVAHPVRRQPAEGRPRPLAARRLPAAAARRADPGRRRRRPRRAVRADPPAGRRRASACCWSPARCPRCSAWPTGCWSCARAGRPRGTRGRARRAQRARPGHGRECRVSEHSSRASPPAPTDEQARVEAAAEHAAQAGGPLARSAAATRSSHALLRNLGLVVRAARCSSSSARSPADNFLTRDNIRNILRQLVGHRRGHRRHDLRDHRRRHRPVGRRARRAGLGLGDHRGHPGLRPGGHGPQRAARRHRRRPGQRRCSSPTAGWCRSSPRWPCWSPPAASPPRSPTSSTQIVNVADHQGHRRRPTSLGIPLLVVIFAVGGRRRLGRAQPHHLRPAHVRHRRQRRGGPARRHRRPPAHRCCSTCCPGCAAASPPSCSWPAPRPGRAPTATSTSSTPSPP